MDAENRYEKKHWTPAEWIAFGNRVKKIRKELKSMIVDVEHVCSSREIAGLMKAYRQLDDWRSSIENVASKDVPGVILTRIFYGDQQLPEDVLERE